MKPLVSCMVLVAAIACGPTRTPTGPARARSPLAIAQAYERGTNEPRDYAKAAAVYDSACANGSGDLAACHELVDAVIAARGATRDLDRAGRLSDALCKRHDLLGCTIVLFMTGRDDAVSAAAKAELAKADPEEACGKGDAISCEVMLAFQFPNFQGSSGLEAKQHAREHLACVAGVLGGCLGLIESVDLCGYSAGAQRCVDHLVADWTKFESHDQLDALAYVRRQCDLGDALACASLPGREIAYAELCKAHDYTACGDAGCLGDRQADAIAKAHGADANCTAVGSRNDAQHAPPPKTRAALPAEPPHGPPAPRAAPPFRSLAFRRLATEEDDWSWPRFEITNLATRKVIYIHIVEYAYDRNGTQIAHSEHATVGPLMLDPGASISPGFSAQGQIPDEAVAFDVCYDFISFEGDTSSGIGGTMDAAGCPDQRVRGSEVPLDATGSLVQRRFHAVASPGAVHYATTEGVKGGASARGLLELAAHTADFAGSDVRSATPGELAIPILVGAVGILYRVQGVTALRLSPATLAKIFQREIKRWNDRAIARDNPGVELPDEPILVFHDVGADGTTDRDADTTRAFIAYLRRAAPGAWHGGAPEAFAWPADMRRAMGVISIVRVFEGAIGYVDVSAAEPGSTFAAMRNRAGAYVAPIAASLRAAARELDAKTGSIDPVKADAYPIAFPSYVVVAATQTDPARGALVVAYLRLLLGDGQRQLEHLGLAALPDPIAATSRALVDHIAVP